MLSNMICTWPLIMSVSAGFEPRYGTCVIFTPVIAMNNSADRCTEVPLPDDARLTLPGLALAWSMNSCTVLAGTLGCTVITFGTRIRPPTGAMSRMKLNGSFL